MRTLIVYYSLSGNTARLADALAEALSADVERLEEVAPRGRFWGAFRGVYEILTGALPDIKPAAHEPASYDLVVIGCPVWAGGAATPLRTYLQKHKGQMARAAFFATTGNVGLESAFKQMQALAGTTAEATLGVTAEDLRSGGWREKMKAFVAALGAAGSENS